MSHVAVVGSVNLDLVATAPRLPRPGETVTDANFFRHPGGKGGNQALAARRMGADVRMIARVGDDTEGQAATALLRDAGVDLAACRVSPGTHTGIAVIVVDAAGENQIVVAPGANRLLGVSDVDVAGADVVVCQLEIPLPTVEHAIRTAAFGVLNCAPARQLPPGLLAECDVVVVNQTEADFYGSDLAHARLVVKTLGADGAVALERGVEVARVPSLRVDTVDTVGAGDTFVGTLAVELADGATLVEALKMATAAGAIATTRSGAQPAIPTRDEVLAARDRLES
ncbi:MAG: ribokinase [Acidimicrobiia bacterium]